jgi:hypothetical protein
MAVAHVPIHGVYMKIGSVKHGGYPVRGVSLGADRNLIRISIIYLPEHRSLKRCILRLIILLRKISWASWGVTNFLK